MDKQQTEYNPPIVNPSIVTTGSSIHVRFQKKCIEREMIQIYCFRFFLQNIIVVLYIRNFLSLQQNFLTFFIQHISVYMS